MPINNIQITTYSFVEHYVFSGLQPIYKPYLIAKLAGIQLTMSNYVNDLSRVLESSSKIKPAIGFYSHLNSCYQYCEGDHELHACLLREFDDEIVSYVTQPRSFGFLVDGRIRRYTPDVLKKFKNGNFQYDEVKSHGITLTRKFRVKHEFLEQAFEEIVKQPLGLDTALSESSCKTICNLGQLYPYRRYVLDADKISRLLPAIPDIRLTGKELEHICVSRGLNPHFGWAMAAYGKFTFSNTDVLRRSSILEVVDA